MPVEGEVVVAAGAASIWDVGVEAEAEAELAVNASKKPGTGPGTDIHLGTGRSRGADAELALEPCRTGRASVTELTPWTR